MKTRGSESLNLQSNRENTKKWDPQSAIQSWKHKEMRPSTCNPIAKTRRNDTLNLQSTLKTRGSETLNMQSKRKTTRKWDPQSAIQSWKHEEVRPSICNPIVKIRRSETLNMQSKRENTKDSSFQALPGRAQKGAHRSKELVVNCIAFWKGFGPCFWTPMRTSNS